jgi:hypothetical protein
LAGSGRSLATFDRDPPQPSAQGALLDRYWAARIIDVDGRGDIREYLVFEATRCMIARRSLTVARAGIQAIDAANLGDVLSRGVLEEWRPDAASQPMRDRVGFAHHTLFD